MNKTLVDGLAGSFKGTHHNKVDEFKPNPYYLPQSTNLKYEAENACWKQRAESKAKIVGAMSKSRGMLRHTGEGALTYKPI